MSPIDKLKSKLEELDGTEMTLLLSILNDTRLDYVVAQVKTYCEEEIKACGNTSKHLYLRDKDDIAYGRKKLAETVITMLTLEDSSNG